MKEAIKEQTDITRDLEELVQKEKAQKLSKLTIEKEQTINDLLRE